MNKNRNDLLMTLRNAIGGLRKHFAGQTLVIEGKPWPVDGLVAMLQRYVDGIVAAQQAYKEWVQMTVVLQADLRAQIAPLMSGLEMYLAGNHGTGSDTYTDHGFTRPKKPYISTETKRAAAELARATRKARGTLGKRQRLAIRGVVTPEPTAAPAPVERTAPPSDGAAGRASVPAVDHAPGGNGA
jgi:hypothetical protein